MSKSSSNSSSSSLDDDHYEDIDQAMAQAWNPLKCPDWDSEKASATCLARVHRDINHVIQDPPPGIFIEPDPNNLTIIHALVVGASGTPYQGGLFYFLIRCPPDYPFRPPRCRLMTTGNNTVRFNPNLYRDGKVCLSILGTWTGPAWTPAQCLSSLLISIQSLMTENPYYNEPGYERERSKGDVQAYNDIITHECLRVAVCEMLENRRSTPHELREKMIEQFHKYVDFYLDVCRKNIDKDGQKMKDPFNEARGDFQYLAILTRLEKLKVALKRPEERDQINPQPNKSLDSLIAYYPAGSNTEPMELENSFDDFSDQQDETNGNEDFL